MGRLFAQQDSRRFTESRQRMYDSMQASEQQQFIGAAEDPGTINVEIEQGRAQSSGKM